MIQCVSVHMLTASVLVHVPLLSLIRQFSTHYTVQAGVMAGDNVVLPIQCIDNTYSRLCCMIRPCTQHILAMFFRASLLH